MKYNKIKQKKINDIFYKRELSQKIFDCNLSKLQECILIERYIKQKNFFEISKKTKYSLSYVYKQHIKAINKLI